MLFTAADKLIIRCGLSAQRCFVTAACEVITSLSAGARSLLQRQASNYLVLFNRCKSGVHSGRRGNYVVIDGARMLFTAASEVITSLPFVGAKVLFSTAGEVITSFFFFVQGCLHRGRREIIRCRLPVQRCFLTVACEVITSLSAGARSLLQRQAR